jgi:uncharacterized protein (TIGR02246 family)
MVKASIALIGAAALALVIGGCQKQAKPDPEAAKNAIKADEKKWNDEFQAKDNEAAMSHYADDAFLVAPGVKGTDGSTEIRKAFAAAGADPAFSLTFAVDKVDAAASGDMAYGRGHFSEKYTDPKTGKVMTDSGSFLTVYKKQQDGSWKAVEDFAAADPGATKPVEPGKPATRARMTSF